MHRTLTPAIVHGQAKVLLFCLCINPERGTSLWSPGSGSRAAGERDCARPRRGPPALKIDTTTRELPSLGQILQLLIEQPSR